MTRAYSPARDQGLLIAARFDCLIVSKPIDRRKQPLLAARSRRSGSSAIWTVHWLH